MTVVNSVVALLFLQTVIILEQSHSVCGAVPPLQCGNEQCLSGFDCHPFVTCPKCPVEPRCVPTSWIRSEPGIDLACLYKGFSEVILIEDPKNVDKLNRLECSGPGDEETCPYGSVCVDAEGGYGVCCKGQQQQQQRRRGAGNQKPGSCPQGQSCSGVMCSADADCDGDQICCNGCIQTCMNPVY